MVVRNYFLNDLKDDGFLAIKHVSEGNNDANIFTKNTTGPIFEKHIPNFVGVDD